MKVAIVSSYCLDSTMPLAKHLGDEQLDIHLYGIMPRGNQNVFVVDFSKNRQSNGFVPGEVSTQQMGKNLSEYLSAIKMKFFIYPGGGKKSLFLRDVYYAWKLSRHLMNGKYDLVHFIHTSSLFSLLLFHFLKKQKIIQTLHEVTNHSGDTSSFNIKILKILIKRAVPIIFNSQVSKDRFLSFRASVTDSKLDTDLYKVIKFSLYETYNAFPPGEKNTPSPTINNSIPIILHFGRIVPYKGIDILIDAVKLIQKNQPVHLIVAGGGDSYFNFDGIDSYEFINYSISNEEIVELIKKCSMVVCPYRSASQSGIPMTVFPFNKPIIASNIGGFAEMIDHNITGLLVDKIDAVSFADAIMHLIGNKELEQHIASNIDKKYKEGEYSWTNIAKETIGFYQNHLKER